MQHPEQRPGRRTSPANHHRPGFSSIIMPGHSSAPPAIRSLGTPPPALTSGCGVGRGSVGAWAQLPHGAGSTYGAGAAQPSAAGTSGPRAGRPAPVEASGIDQGKGRAFGSLDTINACGSFRRRQAGSTSATSQTATASNYVCRACADAAQARRFLQSVVFLAARARWCYLRAVLRPSDAAHGRTLS